MALSLAARGAQQTLAGKISDSMGASDHSMMQNPGTKTDDNQCVAQCIKGGEKHVLVSGNKVYQIQNQTSAGLASNAGSDVTVTGM